MVPQSLSARHHSRPAAWPVLARLAAPFFLAGLVLLAWLLVLSAPWSRPAVAAGTRRYVAPGADCGVASPCHSRVQDAVNAAGAGEEIRVAAGIYTDVVRVGNLTQTVFIAKNLALRGGYVITDWETSRPADRPTILDPQGLGRVIVITGPITVTVDGFVIRNGVALTETGTLYDGGGVYANAATVMLENSVIYSNTAGGGRGGGVHNDGGSVTVRRNAIYSNTAESFGGGISNDQGTLVVQRSVISGNAATSAIARGGGLYNSLGVASLQNNLIYFNTSNGYGGGLSNNPTSTLTLQNDTIYSNTAVTSGGGALDLGTMTVTNAIIWGNGLAITDTGTISVAYSDVYSASGTYPGTGNLNVDPGVADAAAGDFHLTATSPVSDVADPGTTLNEDLEGRARPWPVGGGYDMGAYEYYGPTGACFARLNGGGVYASLQAAVDAASAGGLVQVAGHCVGVQARAGVSQTVYISQSLTVRGGYTVTDWVNPRYGPTILDAQGQGRVVYLTGTGAITLEKLHVTEGQGGAGAGVYIGPQVNARLQNNVIYRNDSTDLGGGIYNAGGVAWLQFNTIYSNTANAGGGIYAQVSGDTTLCDSIVAHNAASNSGGGIKGSGVSLDYNNFYGNTVDDYGSVSPGTHDVSVDPQFSSSAAGDFHLQWTSQVIHAADPDSSLESDFDGEVRPMGPHSDIGADESLLYPAVDLSQAPNSPHIVTDTALIEGTVITFTHTFTNVGNTPSLTDTFVVTATNNDGWPVNLVDITPPVVLTAGASAEFKMVVSVPVTVSEPLFNQTAVTVTSTSNAAARDVVQDVIVKPGVELAPSYTRNADPGEVVTYTHTMTNVGPSDIFTITVASPLMWGRLVTPTGLVGLAHGETRLVVLRVGVTDTAPVNLADVMTVTVTSQSYGVSDSITDTTIANPTIGSRYVRTDGTNTNNNCKKLDWPCAGIAYAVGQATWGDTILVAEGTYSESGIFINQDLALRGGYDSDFGSQRAADATVIDAQNSGRVLRVSLAAPPGSQPEINNFTFKNTQSGGVGGAVYLQGNSSPTLRDLIILDSSATRGGGIYIETGSPTLERVTISGAQADDLGGGIYVGSGSPTIEDVTISHTTALSGGGIYNQSGHFEAEGLSLWDNTAVQGGGLYQASGVLTISGASVASNTASAGGGLYNASGTLTLWNNFIYSNTATAGEGGGLFQDQGWLSVVNNTLFGNQAATFGGGVFDRQGSWLGISNTVMVANTAITSGGAISCAGTGSRALDYNAFWGNSAPASNVATGTHSLSADPLFLDAGAGDLHLDVNSPAIDVGDPDTFLDTDIDGDMRPINQGFDIGADELAGCLAKNRRTGAVYGVVQEAIDEAVPHDVILVAGICRGVQSRQVNGQTLSQTAFIDKPLVLEGGYNRSFIYDGSTTTTLDAEGLGRVVVITDTGSSVTVVISHLTLTGGAGAGLGGGVYNHGNHLDLLGSVITGNQAVYGGGVYNQAGSLFLVGSEGTGQTSVLSNAATYGGGVYLEAGTATLAGTLLAGNSAGQAGGGLYSAGISVTLIAAELDSNTAAYGGGAYHAGGLWSGQAITVAHNSAITGAGLYVADDQATLVTSLVLSNTASGDGGGVHNAAGAALTMTNNLVAGNTASGDGGGLHNLSPDLTVRHDTFYANSAVDQGGGIYHSAGSTVPVINSTLLVNNTASTGGGIHSAGTPPTFAYNDTFPDAVSGFIPDNTNISQDPNFISTDPASSQFLRIPGGSPAEDVADPSSPIAEDIDGDPRPSNQGFDIGADEVGGCYVRVNGASPTYGNIQVAVGHANDGNSLYVAGTCQGVNQAVDGGAVLSQTLFLTKSLTVQGGYAKDDWSVPHPITQPTYLHALSLGRVVVVTGSAQVSVDGLHLTGGDAASGGGILVASGSLSMTGNWVYSNTATYGGGLYNLAGGVTLTDDNDVYSNTATDGGAVYNAGGDITLDDNTLRNNSASGNGGGFYHGGGTSLLQNNIVRGNQAANGGGVCNASTSLTVRHDTIYHNTATNGGGFYTVNGDPTLVNTLLISNTATISGHAVYAGASHTPDYNDAYPATNAYGGSATAGTHSLTVDPLFVDAAGGDFHLQAGSPVVDKGDPAMTLLYDFEGDLRPGDQGFDMGADERSSCRAKIVRTGIVYGNLQTAINNSQSGDQILVTASECRGVHPFDNGGQVISQTVHITHSLTVVGGYQDDFLALSDPLVPTTLNPQGRGRAMLITGSTVVTLSNLYLTNGDAGSLGGRPGGGDAGGGLYYRGNGGTLSNLTIYSNTAAYGGGLFDAGSGLTVTLSLVQSNTASTNGGGIYNYNDALHLVEITVTLNTAGLSGGGIYNQNGSMYLAKNQVHHNSATDNDNAKGGGFYNADGASTLDLGNRLYDNTSAQDGGAIYNANGDLKVWNTLIYQNTANDGGGVFVAGGNPRIQHDVFYKNDADSLTGRGGGIHITDNKVVTVTNSIFYQNAANSGAAIYGEGGGGNPVLSHNYYTNTDRVVGVPIGSGNVIGPSPGLVNPAGSDFHLQSTSPLIDVGQTLALVPRDFESDPRPINVSSDIGADEYNACLAKLIPGGVIYGRIQAALDDPSPTTEIRVAKGTCYESVTVDEDIILSGSWETDFSERLDYVATTIDAAGRGTRVVTVTGSDVSISQVKLTNGTAGGGDGGGLRTDATQLTLSSVDIISNTATDGGGLYVASGKKAVLNDVYVNDNTASGSGGGIYAASNSQVTIPGGGIYYNQASGGHGGGMYCAGGSRVHVTGGASIDGNKATQGGGVYISGAIFTLAQKRINNNTATAGGGMYIAGTSGVTLTNLGLYNNAATSGHGGGLCRSAAGTASLYHATICQNAAMTGGSGGGVYNIGSPMVISASILASNSASEQGSGIYGAANVDVAYTLQWNNAYSGTTPGVGNVVGDPHFRAPDTGGDLLYTSAAIDKVPSSKSHVVIDRYGQTRPDICAKDMGRDEYNVARQMNWKVAPPAGAGGTVPPTGSITYTFSITNKSQNLTGPEGIDNLGIGTGYTETVTATLNSSQGWGQIVGVANGVNPTVTDTVATFEIGPGAIVSVTVRVTVPAGTWASVQDVSKLTYQAWQCPGGPFLSGFSNPATTQVSENRGFDIGPDNFGAAYPGQTVTYTHLVTNIGNITDTYSIFPKVGWYALAEIVQPASHEISNLSPGMTATVVLRVTIRPEAGAGLTDISSVIARNSAPSPVQKAAANNTVISATTGTRYVALSGTDSLVDETGDNPDAIDYPDNNCTQPLVGPCRTIQQAINQSAAGDTVKIAEGRYTDLYTITHASRLITQTALVNKGVMLQGGYQPINWEEDPPNHLSHTTTLDPQDQGRVIYVTQGVAPTLDRLVLINGDADGLGPGDQDVGGDLYNEGAALTLNVMRVVSGSADIGGGLYHNDGVLLVQNSLLYGSQAITGGALYVGGGTATVLNDTFYNDTATDQGSAVYVAGGSLLVTNTIFATNTTAGAAVHGAPGATSVLGYNLFFNNVLTHTGGTVGAPSPPSDVLADPRFVDPTAYPPDLYPGSGSPVREAGDPSTVANTGLMSWDYGNHLRRLGPRIDIGAYEYVVQPRVEFEPDVYTETTTTGGDIVFAHWLTNTGDITDTFTITYSGSLTWPVTISPGVVTLNMGAVSDVVVTVTVPAGAGGLTDQLVITATSDVTHTVYDTVRDTIFVVFAPQFEFAKDEWGTTGPLQTITYTHRITNTSNGQDTYVFTPTVRDSLPLTVAVTPPQVTLPVSGSQVITVSVTPPGPSQAVSGTVGSVVISATSTFSHSVQHAVTDTTTISQVFGLDLAPDREGSGLPGGGVPYHHILTQLGNYTQTVVLTYTTVPTWQVSLPVSHTMSPGGAISITAVVTVPLDSRLGVTNVTRLTAQLATNPVISDTAVDTTTTGLDREVIIEPPLAQTGLPGHVVTYTHTVTNLGNANDRFGITPGGSAFTSALASSSPITLVAFASDQVTVTVQVPYLISGTVDVLTVTAASEFSPTTALDAVTDTTTVGHLPAVVFEPDRTGDGELGQVAVYTHTVTNVGNYTDTLALTYTANLTWPVVISPTPPGSIQLGINQSARVTASVTITQGGFLHTALITASSESDANFSDRVMVTTTLTLPASPTLVAPPNGHITKTAAITFEWSPTGASTYTLALNGTPYTVTTNISPTMLEEGVYTWTAASVDPFGRRGPYAAPWTVTVDLTAPSVPTPTMPLTGTSVQTRVVTFGWDAASDNLIYYPLDYRVVVIGDGGSYVDTVHDFTSTILTLGSDGVYTWTVEAIDAAGNESGFSTPIAFFVDASPPLPPLLIAPSNGTVTNTHAITLTWQDRNVPPVTTYTVYISNTTHTVTDSGAAPGKTVYSPTVLSDDGVYTWTVRAIDQFDRPSNLAATWVFTVDTVPPTIPSLTAPLSGTALATTTVPFDWTSAEDSLSGVFSYTLNASGTLYSALTDGATVSLPGEGIYTWTVRAHDRAGNASAYTDTWQLLVDMTPPSVPTPTVPMTGTSALTKVVTFDWEPASDNFTYPLSYTVVVTGDGGPYGDTVHDFTSTVLTLGADGVYTWVVQAIDSAGNESGFCAPVVFFVDATPPLPPVLVAPANGTLTNTHAITLTWQDHNVPPVTTYTLHIADTAYTVTDTYSPTVLGQDGVYTWTVRAIDQFNRPSDLAATCVFTVDTTPPTTPSLTAPLSGTVLATTTVAFDWTPAQDALSGVFRYTLNVSGTLYTALSDAATVSLPGDGVYTWTVKAHDRAGNAGAYTDTWQVLIDVTAPTPPVPITPTGGVALTYTTPITLVWQASHDTASGVVSYTAVVTDSGGSQVEAVTVPAPLTSTPSLTITPDGTYTWAVWAVDRAGNVSEPGGPATFVVDAFPPDNPFLIAPPDGMLTNTGSITFTWSHTEQTVTHTLHLTGDTYNTYNIPDTVPGPIISPTQLADGVYTWTVEAIDSFVRTSGITDTWVFTVDATAPTVPVPTYPYTAALLLARPVPFTWHASSDETSGVVNYQVVVTGPTQSYWINAGAVTSTVHSLGADGVYTWRVRAVDAAANASDFSHPITFTLDANPPDIPTRQSPPHQSFTNDPDVAFTWSPSTDTVTYTVDINGAFYDVLAPTTFMSFTTPLADGLYHWTVQAVDIHSRTLGYATPAWWVRVDTRPPAAPTLISPPDGAVTSTHHITLNWLAVISDTSSGPELSVPLTYTLSISGQAPLEVTGNTAVVNLVTGFYTWTVWATDRAGNVGPSSQAFTFTDREPFYSVHLPLVLKDVQPQPGPTPTPTPVPGPTPTPTPVPPAPDLVVDSITLTHNQGGGYTVKVTVRNQSSIPVTYGNNFHVSVYIDPAQPPTYANIPTLTPDIEWGVQGSWFGAGQSRQLEATYTFDSVGSHTLYAWADPYRVVVESNEDNNERILTQTINVLGGVSSSQGSSTSPPGPQPTPTNTP